MLGLARNTRLVQALDAQLQEARDRQRRTGGAAQCYRDFLYRTRQSGSRARRVVGQAEYLARGPHPRFVVTHLPAAEASARRLYEKLSCARGDRENRIQEQQLDLFADRPGTPSLRAHQLRLYFSSFAYVLLQGLRRLGARGPELARARCATLRVQLGQVGARVRLPTRRVGLSFSQAYPSAALCAQVLENLRRAPPGVASG